MAHIYELRNIDGELVDVVVFCSDFCHREWALLNSKNYQGWNGCHEVNETNCERCASDLLNQSL